jgi:tryptophan synthase alpha chain
VTGGKRNGASGGRIARAFTKLRTEGRAGFVPFLTFGDPEPSLTLPLLLALARAGADLIELGVPFSDPMADGPVLQRSAERALAGGATLRGCLDVVAEFRRQSDVPVILFGYYNPLFRYGLQAIAADARAAGADGFLCVDLPPEESADLDRSARAEGLDLIYLLAPTSTLERMRKVLSRARGFVYFVAVTGVTGVRSSLPENLETLIRSVKRLTPLPIGVGFGISTPEQARRVATFADAVIVGSAIARVIETTPREGVIAAVEQFVGSLAEATIAARAVGAEAPR